MSTLLNVDMGKSFWSFFTSRYFRIMTQSLGCWSNEFTSYGNKKKTGNNTQLGGGMDRTDIGGTFDPSSARNCPPNSSLFELARQSQQKSVSKKQKNDAFKAS